MCRCEGGSSSLDDDVVVQLCAGSDQVWVPLDTGARSIWVDRA